MKIFSELENAQIENRTTNWPVGVAARLWFRTDLGRIFMDDSAAIKALLRNDDHIILGNSVTPANNARLHRGANKRIQLLTGDDVTLEGIQSNSLAEFSSIIENYINSGKPANATANKGRLIYVTDLQEYQFDTGTVWNSVGGGALVAAGTTSSPINISAGGGITPLALGKRQIHFVQGSAGPVEVTTAARVGDGVDLGNEIFIVGCSDDNWVGLADGNNLRLNGDKTLVNGSVLGLIWDGLDWLENTWRD